MIARSAVSISAAICTLDYEMRRIRARMVRNTQMSRRAFISRAGSLAFASTMLGACGGVEGTANKATPTPSAARHPEVALDRIEFSNWPLYIDRKVIKDFERRFDVDLHYVEDINDNSEFFAKGRQQPEQ